MSSRRITTHELDGFIEFVSRRNIDNIKEMKSGVVTAAIKSMAKPGMEADLIEFCMSLVRMQSTMWVRYVRTNNLLTEHATRQDRNHAWNSWRIRFITQELPKMVDCVKFRFEADDHGYIVRGVFEDIHSSYAYAAARIGRRYPEAPDDS